MVALWQNVPGVKLLLLSIYVGDDKAQDLLHMLDTHQMRCGLRVLKEMYQAHIWPLFVLQNYLPQSQQHPLGFLQRPIVLKQVRNKYVFQLILVLGDLLYTVLSDKFGVDGIEHHNPAVIDFPMLAVNFLAQKCVVKPM